MNRGVAGDLVVNAANDRVQRPTTTSDAIARIIDAAVPTNMGDQELRCDGYLSSSVTNASSSPTVRCASAGTADFYYMFFSAGTLELYRCDASTFVLLTSAARTITTGSNALRMRATGTNPVALEVQVAATAVVTFNDSNANRKQSGAPGIGLYNLTANTVFIDNVEVDDLLAADILVGQFIE